MAMLDINGEEFFVGDTLKVIKEVTPFNVGDVVVCSYDVGLACCEVHKLVEDPERSARWVVSKRLQKV